jgi:hypothetical protein
MSDETQTWKPTAQMLEVDSYREDGELMVTCRVEMRWAVAFEKEKERLLAGSVGRDSVKAAEDLVRAEKWQLLTDAFHGLGRPVAKEELPREPGLYWWREVAGQAWRLVEWRQFDSLGNVDHLAAYDLQERTFGGRSRKVWAEHAHVCPIGYWVKIEKPAEVRLEE